eukprot:gene18777-biopygen904
MAGAGRDMVSGWWAGRRWSNHGRRGLAQVMAIGQGSPQHWSGCSSGFWLFSAEFGGSPEVHRGVSACTRVGIPVFAKAPDSTAKSVAQQSHPALWRSKTSLIQSFWLGGCWESSSHSVCGSWFTAPARPMGGRPRALGSRGGLWSLAATAPERRSPLRKLQ